MKILYVTHLSNLTGSNQSLLDMLSSLKKTDNELLVLIGKRGALEDKLKELGIRYVFIPYSTDIKEGNQLKNKLKTLKNRMAVGKIIELIRRENINIVHSNNQLVSVGSEAAYKAGVPYIVHAREMLSKEHNMEIISEKKARFYLRHASAAIYISDFIKNRFQPTAPRTRYKMLHDGMDTQKYLLPDRQLFAGDEITLLLAGRISPGKGQLEAIKALDILRGKTDLRFRLFIVGDSGTTKGNVEYRESLRRYTEEHSMDNVDFIGFTDLTELRSRIDIGLICSTDEALGRVTLESMLSGCITIGADTGATPELITEGETGYLYTHGSPEALADKILYAINNKDKAPYIVKNAREFVCAGFDPDNYAKAITHIYSVITKEK